jgi:hypothetical protein
MWRKTRSDYGSIVDCKVGHKENILKGGGYCFARKQLLDQITVPLLCYKDRKKSCTQRTLMTVIVPLLLLSMGCPC